MLVRLGLLKVLGSPRGTYCVKGLTKEYLWTREDFIVWDDVVICWTFSNKWLKKSVSPDSMLRSFKRTKLNLFQKRVGSHNYNTKNMIILHLLSSYLVLRYKSFPSRNRRKLNLLRLALIWLLIIAFKSYKVMRQTLFRHLVSQFWTSLNSSSS